MAIPQFACHLIMVNIVIVIEYGGVEGCVREGNGTTLQYSCLENPMDGGAW